MKQKISFYVAHAVTFKNTTQVKSTVTALPRLRALWLNGNGVARPLAAAAEVQGRLEIYNRRLTGAYSGWALRYLATGAKQKEQVWCARCVLRRAVVCARMRACVNGSVGSTSV